MIQSAATGSAHVIPQKAFTTKPASAMIDKFPQGADSAASALKAALAFAVDNLRSAVPAVALQPLPHSMQQSQAGLASLHDSRSARCTSDQLLEIRTDETNEIFCQLYGRHCALFVAHHVQPDVVFENFSHEAVDPAAHIGQ
jgi:hypothetical protein